MVTSLILGGETLRDWVHNAKMTACRNQDLVHLPLVFIMLVFGTLEWAVLRYTRLWFRENADCMLVRASANGPHACCSYQLLECKFQLSHLFPTPDSHQAAGKNAKETHRDSHWAYHQRQKTCGWSFTCLGKFTRVANLWPTSKYNRQWLEVQCFTSVYFVFFSVGQLFS